VASADQAERKDWVWGVSCPMWCLAPHQKYQLVLDQTSCRRSRWGLGEGRTKKVSPTFDSNLEMCFLPTTRLEHSESFQLIKADRHILLICVIEARRWLPAASLTHNIRIPDGIPPLPSMP